jgi:hypothetical protein
LFTLIAVAGIWIVAASPALALPPCSQAATYTWCNADCQIIYGLPCTGLETNFYPPDCEVIFHCGLSRTIRMGCDCDGGGGCFLSGTPITMADGSLKPIETIEVGDVVLAFDEATGEMKPDKVSVVHDPVDWESYLLVNGALKLTPPHPVLSDGEWVEIGKLVVGDSLTSADGSKVLIESIEVVSEPVTVYNFATNPCQTYVAGGFIVHNKNPYIPNNPEPDPDPRD